MDLEIEQERLGGRRPRQEEDFRHQNFQGRRTMGGLDDDDELVSAFELIENQKRF